MLKAKGHLTLLLTYLHWVEFGASAANTLHSSDCHASHTAQWSEAGIDCHMSDSLFSSLIAGHHHCTCPTSPLSTTQLTPSQTYCNNDIKAYIWRKINPCTSIEVRIQSLRRK